MVFLDWENAFDKIGQEATPKTQYSRNRFSPCISEAVRTQNEISTASMTNNASTARTPSVTRFIADEMEETTAAGVREAVLKKSLTDPDFDLLDKARFDNDVNSQEETQPRNL